jgi:hypothetical protein
VAAGLLSLAGALLARKRRACPWPGWKEPPVIWTAAIGNPSAGKSPALDATMEPARELEAELNADYLDRVREWNGGALAAELHQQTWEQAVKTAIDKHLALPAMPADCDPPARPHRRRLITSDTTPEKLVEVVAANPFGVLLHRDELAGWLGNMDRYGGSGGDRALYLEAYGARPYTRDRMKDPNPIQCDALAVCICGGIQPDRLASLLLAGDDDGLVARILYFWPDPAPVTAAHRMPPVPSPLPALQKLASLTFPETGALAVPFTAEAADDMVSWQSGVRAMEASASGMMLSWLGKMPGLAARLALILEHLWWSWAGLTHRLRSRSVHMH